MLTYSGHMDEQREQEVLSDPELMAAINEGIEQARQGDTVSLDFSKYLDDTD